MNAPAEKVATSQAIVAEGHCLKVPSTKDGRMHTLGPGETITLPETEIARLRELGFLVAAASTLDAALASAPEPSPPRATPSIQPKDGPSVKRRHAD